MFFRFCTCRSLRKIHLPVYQIGDPCSDPSLLIINNIEIDGEILLRLDYMDNLGNYLLTQS